MSTPERPHYSKAYDSTQWIALPDDMSDFDSRTNPDALLRMLQQYLAVAQRCVCGLVRVRWSDGRPRFVLAWPPVTMIQMGEPTYETLPERSAVSVTVDGGLLVADGSGARLAIAVTRLRDSAWAAGVELRHYMPRGGQSAVVDWVYRQTQVRVHTLVGLRWLRQCRRRWQAQGD
jgi:hypothetical protein